MQNSNHNSWKDQVNASDSKMIQSSMVLIKVGELLLNQGLLTLGEKKDFQRMSQEKL